MFQPGQSCRLSEDLVKALAGEAPGMKWFVWEELQEKRGS